MTARLPHTTSFVRAIATTAICVAALGGTSDGANASTVISKAPSCGKAAGAPTSKLAPRAARKTVLCLINRERASRGMAKLHSDRRLQRAAQRHNRRMDGTGCFSHRCPGEPALTRRVTKAGYLRGARRWMTAENVAWGADRCSTPEAIVRSWMHSTGHRAMILTREFEDVGIGVSVGTPAEGRADGGIYTTDFGLAD